ncbi:hypothetical protein [Vibrio penaeicida]|uniref:Uncharacterized protein n=1 Tax=Vibrio penaeicida TaxID=104609 RepID=A0AAV5NRC5_9VIBR|nr:hypothetical protein [Vibrio penaeicida]RTZ21398.1 hypothetical protein EKN09_19510 [Vibrio penaeicida]GLQ73165.1 hypothetical protein GCM10007932_25250 [Vibrio penaeicida]
MKLKKAVLLASSILCSCGLATAKEALKPAHYLTSANQVLSGKVVSENNTDIVYADITKADLKEENLKAYSPWDELYQCTEAGSLKNEAIIVSVGDKFHVMQACDALGFDLDIELSVVDAAILNGEASDLAKSASQIILVPTPSSDETYLYWNGNKFKLFVPMPF